MAKITSWRCDGCKREVQCDPDKDSLPEGWETFIHEISQVERDQLAVKEKIPGRFQFCPDCMERFRSPGKRRRAVHAKEKIPVSVPPSAEETLKETRRIRGAKLVPEAAPAKRPQWMVGEKKAKLSPTQVKILLAVKGGAGNYGAAKLKMGDIDRKDGSKGPIVFSHFSSVVSALAKYGLMTKRYGCTDLHITPDGEKALSDLALDDAA